MEIDLAMFATHGIWINTRARQLFMNMSVQQFADPKKHTYLSDMPIPDQKHILSILTFGSDQEIIRALSKSFGSLYKSAQKNEPFNDIQGSPYRIIDNFSVYELIRQKIGSATRTYSDQEKAVLSVMAAIQENNTMPQRVVNVQQKDNPSGSPFARIFAGDPTIYSFVASIIFGTGLSLHALENVSLSQKDYESIFSHIKDFFNSEEILKNTTAEDDVSSYLKSLEEEPHTYAELECIGVIFRVFANAYTEQVLKTQDLEKKLAAEQSKTYTSDPRIASLTALADSKQSALNELQKKCDKLLLSKEKLQDQVKSLQRYCNVLEDGADTDHEQVFESEEKLQIPDGNIVLLGGHPRWQARFSQEYPHVRIIRDTDSFSTDLIKNADLVLINIRHLYHSKFMRAINVIRDHKKPVQYV